jgi:hypothetical protein
MASNTQKKKRVRKAKAVPNRNNLKIDQKRIEKNLEILDKLASA